MSNNSMKGSIGNGGTDPPAALCMTKSNVVIRTIH